jgi:nucleoside-diphosphate-sugar epimerase
MKILVVGGAGYVGGAVTDLLLDANQFVLKPSAAHEILVYDSLLYEDQFRKPVPFVRGDIRDRDRLLPHLRWADCVVWLAALVGDGACALDPALSVEVNQESVRWLADNFSGRVIFLSTCSVYGAQDGELDELSVTNPLSVYASTKLRAEEYLLTKNALIFRLGTLFGLGDTYSRVRFDLVLNTLTLRAHQTGKITVFGGQQYRPLLHVRDAARAIVDGITQSQTGVYNLSRSNWSIADLAGIVATEFPDLEIIRTPQHFEDHRNYQVSVVKAVEELRFRSVASLSEGVYEIKRLLDEQRILNPEHPRHTNARFLSSVLEAAR